MFVGSLVFKVDLERIVDFLAVSLEEILEVVFFVGSLVVEVDLGRVVDFVAVSLENILEIVLFVGSLVFEVDLFWRSSCLSDLQYSKSI